MSNGNGELAKRIFNRRLKVAGSWAVLNYATLFLQPLLTLSEELCLRILDKSTWVAGLLIVGLSGTDLMIEWVKKSKGDL